MAVVNVPEFKQQTYEYDREYKRTAKWDAQKGDFVLDGTNKIVECSGEEGFVIWCYKVAQTERYSCLAYTNAIGVELEKAMNAGDRKVVESMVQRTLTDALKVNPRTENILNFEFTWNADVLHCTFTVKACEWDKLFKISI